MTLDEYQEKAMKTCLPSSNNFSYMLLNLVGEVGEFTGQIAKEIRNDRIEIKNDQLIYKPGINQYDIEKLQKEAGDILWQLSGLCTIMGWSLNTIAQQNLIKLQKRQETNALKNRGEELVLKITKK